MPYKKYDPKIDSLEDGMKIKFAGVEMVIKKGYLGGLVGQFVNSTRCITLPFEWFTDFEIFIQPLTIPRRTKKIVLEKYLDPKINYETFRAFLYSLEVTND